MPIFSNVGNGLQTSCGKCDWRTKEQWLAQKWGFLRITDNPSLPEEWGPYSQHKVAVQCDCGNENIVRFSDINKHGTKSCGRCNYRPSKSWISESYGKLALVPDQPFPKAWGPGCTKPMLFVCICGKQSRFGFDRVNSGHNKSCGRCLEQTKEYWLAQKWGKVRLDPQQALSEFWGSGSNLKMAVICDCGNSSLTNFYDLTSGKVQSCGCVKLGTRESSPAKEIYRYVLGLSPDARLSYKFFPPDKIGDNRNKKEYDIYVPSKRLAIEYHGLHWHTEDQIWDGDYRKYLISLERGDRLIQVYADEWGARRTVIEQLLKSLLSPDRGRRVKPSYEAEQMTSFEALKFMDEHHYIGGSSGFLTIKAVWKGEIIGAWVFKKREKDVAVWHRASWNHSYTAWNPHGKALEMALPVLQREGIRVLLTFSDNRLHTGELYKQLGFHFEADVAPNYYYTNGRTRKTKYAFRVPAGVDEQESARRQGWHRIWDSGKKRFSLSIPEK